MSAPDESPKPTRPPARRRWSRGLLAAVAAAVPLVPIVIALSVSGGTPGRAIATAAAQPYTALPGPHEMAHRHATPRLLPDAGALVAVLKRPAALRAAPGGPPLGRLQTRTEFGSPQVMWVRRVQGRWLGVVSTLAGNNHLGWITTAYVSLTRVDWVLKVDLARRSLTVIQEGRVRKRYTVAIGAPASPTPTGRFDVTDRLLTGDPQGPYGCCILALSAVAPHAIQGWTGGNRIAIHSTPETWTIGQPVSHGCLRLTLAEGRWLIEHVPLGTPAVISSGPV